MSTFGFAEEAEKIYCGTAQKLHIPGVQIAPLQRIRG